MSNNVKKDIKYKKLDKKPHNIISKQTTKPKEQVSFYSRDVDQMNTEFYMDEMHLPNKNLKNYLNNKPKYWTWNMALEAQTANNYLHIADQDHFWWQVAKKSDHLCKYSLHKINQNSKNEKKS